MEARIRHGAKPHLYIREWRLAKFPTKSAEEFASLLDVDRTTIWRWENDKRRPKPEEQAKLIHVLGIEASDLWRPPPPPDARPSIDEMLRNADSETYDAVADLARRLSRRAS